MSALVHVANVLFFCSYLVRDILWLRLFSVIAGFCLVPYFYFQPTPLWAPIAWNVVFMTLNAAQIARLVRERRPVTLSADEQRLYQLVFRSLTPREFARLIALARWHDAPAGERLVAEGELPGRVLVLVDGAATVAVGGAPVARLAAGRLVGEMSFLTGEKTSASVTTDTPARYVAWPAAELRKFLDDSAELRAAWQLVVGADLATKLRAA
jgi:Popeye protein conserved region